MGEALRNQWQAKVAAAIFLFFFAWWVYIQVSTNTTDTIQHQIFAATYGVMAFIGGIWGLLIARKWGGYKSLIGRSIMFFSLGLLAQEFGQLVYSFYIYFLKVEVPYPSLGDLGYFGSVILYCLAGIFLAKAAGVTLRFKSMAHVIPVLLITFGILGLGFYLFLQDYVFDWSSPMRVFLDFGYPIGEAIYISIAIGTYILSKGMLGGVMKSKILFLIFALCMQFVADYTFLYQASRETWYAGGVNDYVYLLSYFLMTIGLLEFGLLYNKLKNAD